jgi:hypothetical protein
MRGIAEALSVHGALSYEALSVLVFGHGFTISDRASLSRAVRAMERKGEVKIFHDLMVQCAARADFDHNRDLSWEERDWEIRRAHSVHVEEARRAAAAVVPSTGGRPVDIARTSRAELLRQDPSYGDRQDCLSCGASYRDCFLAGDNYDRITKTWTRLPTQCCFECFHREIERLPAARFSSNGHHPRVRPAFPRRY